MCGFIFKYPQEKKINDKDKKSIKNILHHRGPENASLLISNNCLFVHNRLKIIDISDSANQPFISTTSGNILVFNGEIYNYNDLKRKYSSLEWKTESDTEVILNLFDLLGPQFIEEINGIFSFVILDKNRNKIYCYRDRLGVKPLYYHLDDNTINISSEIKGILPFITNNNLNYKLIYEYIQYGLLEHNRSTFFKNIMKVAPGNYLEVDLKNKNINEISYWDVGTADNSYQSEDDIIDQTLFLLKDIIELNLISDVEVGLSLSSGFDSTLLYLLLKNQNANLLKCFTYGYNEKDYDEIIRIKNNEVLRINDHIKVYMQKDKMLNTLEEAMYYFESPLGGLGTLSSYNMMKVVSKNGIKVMLSGEGADEVFGGYQYYYNSLFKDLMYNEEKLSKELFLYNKLHGSNKQITLSDLNKISPSSKNITVLAPDGTRLSGQYLSNDLIGLLDNNIVGYQNNNSIYLSHLKNSMYLDLKMKKLPKLLHFQDRSSSAHGVESRVPFLDHRLIEFIYSLPPHMKIRNGKTKYLIRNIIENKFGVRLKEQNKHYVSAPQREWLKKDIYNDITDLLKGGAVENSGIINMANFLSDYKAYKDSNELGNSFFIWKMINLEYFLRIYNS